MQRADRLRPAGVVLHVDAVTGAGGIPVGYATLALVYLGLALAIAWILRRLARAPLDPVTAPPTAKEA
jgi:hypothetical protein